MGTTADAVSAIDPSFVPRFRDEVAFVPVKDEALLYVERTGQLHQLDPIGTVICQVFDGDTSVDAAADTLADVFQAPSEQVAVDVLEFARRLGGYGLLDGITGDEEADDPAADGL